MTNESKSIDNITRNKIPKEPVASGTDSLPSAITFFVSNAQRKIILSKLRSFANDRSIALSIALGLAEADTSSQSHSILKGKSNQ